jgi:hypothetical protein
VVTRAEEIAHAREVDTEVARLYGEWHQQHDQVLAVRKRIRDARKTIARFGPSRYVSDRLERDLAHIEALELIDEEYKREADRYNDENYGGWNRFFLVQHIHSSMHCSSFRPTTKVGWLPDVSGLTAEEAVAAHGETLCTKCFPGAPVALTTPKADPTVCPGSGGPYDHEKLTGRERAHYSPAGYCPVCGEWTALTARFSGKLRKHKVAK